MSIKNEIVSGRIGDIYRMEDNLKYPGSKHLYMIVSEYYSYRRNIQGVIFTTSCNGCEDFVKMRSYDGTLCFINPYSLYNISSKMLVSGKYIGYVNPKAEVFQLVVACMKSGIGYSAENDEFKNESIDIWRKNYNEHFDSEYPNIVKEYAKSHQLDDRCKSRSNTVEKINARLAKEHNNVATKCSLPKQVIKNAQKISIEDCKFTTLDGNTNEEINEVKIDPHSKPNSFKRINKMTMDDLKEFLDMYTTKGNAATAKSYNITVGYAYAKYKQISTEYIRRKAKGENASTF